MSRNSKVNNDLPEEPFTNVHAYSLSELNLAIREALELAFPDTVWVIAEISEARCNLKGHCYLELVEKRDDNIIAQMRANIWSYTYRNLSQKFERATGESLKVGMQMLLSVDVSFHEVYGLSLNIKDIDPTYSLGEMARKKKETIERLVKEGLINLNKALPLPLVPQRIAVISSSTAAGYGDFINHIEHNPEGYRIYHDLYQAVMQGQEAEASIIKALREIRNNIAKYDVLIIIRGGGSQLDLSCFDSYNLGVEIAKFPTPVITGIGHERDDTVTDIVAHTKLKTPTAVAEFLITGLREFEERLLLAQQRLTELAKGMIKDEWLRLKYITQDIDSILQKRFYEERHKLHSAIHGLRQGTGNIIYVSRNGLSVCITKFSSSIRAYLQGQWSRLSHFGQAVRLLDPINILKRGYSITYHRNKAVKDTEKINKDDILITKVYKGSIKSTVEAKDE